MIKINDKYYVLLNDLKTYKEKPENFEQESGYDFSERIKNVLPNSCYYYDPTRSLDFHWRSIATEKLLLIMTEWQPNESAYIETPWNQVFIFPNAVFVYYECADVCGHDPESHIIYYNTYQEYLDTVTGNNKINKFIEYRDSLDEFLGV